MATKRRRQPCVVLLGVGLASMLAASCSSSTTAKPADKNGALLAAGVLRANDLPPGWVSSRPANANNGDFTAPVCSSINTALDVAKGVPTVQSPQFRDPHALTLADNQVFAFSDTNQARSYLAGYKASDAANCLESVYSQPFGPSGVHVQGTPMVSPVADLGGVGDESVGYQVVVNLSGGSSNFALYWDLIYVRVGRATVHFVFNNVGQRLAQETGIVSAVTGRLARVAQ